MKNLRYFIAIVLAAPFVWACYSDSADNPKFGDADMPRIYSDWLANLTYNQNETLTLDHPVSPSDGATYTWTLDGKVISNERVLNYVLADYGNFTLRFEVTRKGVTNYREAALVVAKPFVAKTTNKVSMGFVTGNGQVSDVPWNDISHLVVSSIEVNGNGLAESEMPLIQNDLSALITTAHNNGVYVLLQFSGVITHMTGAATYGAADFYNAAAGESTRAGVIASMLEYTARNGFDGISVYMDKDHVGAGFPNPTALKAFFDDLAAAAPATTERGKFYLAMSLYTGWTSWSFAPFIGNERYDFFNVMAMGAEDLTPGPHSSFWGLMEPAVTQWIGQGVPKEKLIPVAPAYGLRYFGNTADYTWGNLWQYTEYIPYRTLCATYSNAPSTNTQAVDNGIFYDGLADVKAKAEWAANQGWGGMGLWSVDSDAKEVEKSLMHQINVSLGN